MYGIFSRTLFLSGGESDMIRKISQLASQKFVFYKIIHENDYEIYRYGFELFFSLLLTVIIIFIISFFLEKMFETFLYLIGFFIVRIICGGYHAKHHISCFITSLLTYCLFLFLYNLIIKDKFSLFFIVLMILISVLIILVFTPVEHPNNPMSIYRKKKNRRRGFILSISIFVTFLITMIAPFLTDYFIPVFIGIFIAAVAMLVAEIEILFLKRKEVRE